MKAKLFVRQEGLQKHFWLISFSELFDIVEGHTLGAAPHTFQFLRYLLPVQYSFFDNIVKAYKQKTHEDNHFDKTCHA